MGISMETLAGTSTAGEGTLPPRPPQREVDAAARFYQQRLVERGYSKLDQASFERIAEYFGRTYLGMRHLTRNPKPPLRKPEKGLLLYGPCGVGKTFALEQMADIFSIPMIYADKLARRYVELGDGAFWAFCEQFDGEDLIVDDICSERDLKSFGNESAMVDFLVERERLYRRKGILTHFSTNLKSGDELAVKYGDRVASRILGMCEVVLVSGEDRRRTI